MSSKAFYSLPEQGAQSKSRTNTKEINMVELNKREKKICNKSSWWRRIRDQLVQCDLVETMFKEENLPQKIVLAAPKIKKCNRLIAMTGTKFFELGLNTVRILPRTKRFRVVCFYKDFSSVQQCYLFECLHRSKRKDQHKCGKIMTD